MQIWSLIGVAGIGKKKKKKLPYLAVYILFMSLYLKYIVGFKLNTKNHRIFWVGRA